MFAPAENLCRSSALTSDWGEMLLIMLKWFVCLVKLQHWELAWGVCIDCCCAGVTAAFTGKVTHVKPPAGVCRISRELGLTRLILWVPNWSRHDRHVLALCVNHFSVCSFYLKLLCRFVQISSAAFMFLSHLFYLFTCPCQTLFHSKGEFALIVSHCKKKKKKTEMNWKSFWSFILCSYHF